MWQWWDYLRKCLWFERYKEVQGKTWSDICLWRRMSQTRLVDSSACSRDSIPRDWSRLGSIFLVSVSPIIPRDSRDWGQHYFLVLDLLKCLFSANRLKICPIIFNINAKSNLYSNKRRFSSKSNKFRIMFMYSKKTTKFCKIFNWLFSNVVPVKSKVKISQNFMTFSEYMNFTFLSKESKGYALN